MTKKIKIKVCPLSCRKHRDHVYITRPILRRYEQFLNAHDKRRFYPVMLKKSMTDFEYATP